MHREIDQLKKFASYLGAMQYEPRPGDAPPLPFVTISREAGAGGHAVAAALIERLDAHGGHAFEHWQIADRDICEQVAASPELNVSLPALLDERYNSTLEDLVGNIFFGHSSQDTVLRKTAKIVRELATAGRVILLGRGGVVLTQDLPGGIHIRLIAPRTNRLRRIMELTGLSRTEAERRLDVLDEARQRLFQEKFAADIADPSLYTATYDTGKLSYEQVARSILSLIESQVETGMAGGHTAEVSS